MTIKLESGADKAADTKSVSSSGSGSSDSAKQSFTLYKERWLVLLSIASLNITINAMQMSYSAIATVATGYFLKTTSEIDLLTGICLAIGVPLTLFSTYFVDRLKLKVVVWMAAILSFIGSAFRFFGTMPGFIHQDPLDPGPVDRNVQYWLVFVGQVFIGLGNPLTLCLPTKVGQDWFAEREAPIASAVVSMSFVLGITLGYGLTPVMIPDAEDLPILNVVWFVASLISLLITVFCVKTAKPPTPPSKSAELFVEGQKYSHRMKALLTNPNYLIVVLTFGGAIGLFNGVISQLQQLLCSKGYPGWFVGLTGTVLLATGVFGGMMSTAIAHATGKLEETAKICYGLGTPIIITIFQLYMVPKMEIAVIIFAAICGIFTFGLLPLGFELSLETTYPVDPAAGISLIFASGQLQGTLLIILAGVFEGELSQTEIDRATCGVNENGETLAKDHTIYVLFMCGLATLFAIITIIFLKPKYNRRNANRMQ